VIDREQGERDIAGHGVDVALEAEPIILGASLLPNVIGVFAGELPGCPSLCELTKGRGRNGARGRDATLAEPFSGAADILERPSALRFRSPR
jgi:hypothetical protein